MELFTIYIGTQPNPEDRETISVSGKDLDRIAELHQDMTGKTVTVADQKTASLVTLRSADCGLPNCRCAVERVPAHPEIEAVRMLARADAERAKARELANTQAYFDYPPPFSGWWANPDARSRDQKEGR